MTDHSTGAPAKKRKSLTLHTLGYLKDCLRDCLSSLKRYWLIDWLFLFPSFLLHFLFLLLFSFFFRSIGVEVFHPHPPSTPLLLPPPPPPPHRHPVLRVRVTVQCYGYTGRVAKMLSPQTSRTPFPDSSNSTNSSIDTSFAYLMHDTIHCNSPMDVYVCILT